MRKPEDNKGDALPYSPLVRDYLMERYGTTDMAGVKKAMEREAEELGWKVTDGVTRSKAAAKEIPINAAHINADSITSATVTPHDKFSPLGAEETPDAWSFKNGSVASKFDAHVREQLPWYDVLSQYVADLAASFIPNGGVVYDIGASTGNMARLLEGTLESKEARIINIEPSFEMLAHFNGPGELLAVDAEQLDYSKARPDVAIVFLTFMFMAPAKREDFLSKLLWNLQPGGAIILVDKGYMDSPEIQVACKAAQLAQKMRSGTPAQSYVTKELSLRGEQRPTTGYSIVKKMYDADFVAEEVFRFGEFYGLLGIKRSV